MSVLTYNGVSINLPTITSFNSEAVYDDADMGVVRTKTTITVSGILEVPSLSTNLPAQMNTLRKALMEPRKNLVVSIGGDDVYNVTAPDDYGGPKPRRCDVYDIIGSQFAKVDYEIELNQEECPDTTPSNIVAHRWSVSHQMDVDFYTTRTIRGTLTLREAATSNSPDALRGTVAPAIPKGFIRQSMNFLVTTDGLRLEYDIVDREVYRPFPSPATQCNAQFTVQMGADFLYYNNFAISITGTKAATKLDLFAAAITISASRIGPIDNQREILRGLTVQEELYENTLRIQITTQVTDPTVNGPSGVPIPSSCKLFQTVANSSGDPQDPGPYGTSLLAAAKQTFYDACVGGSTSLVAGTTGGSSYGPQVSTGVITPVDSSSPTGSQTSYMNSSQNATPYLYWRESYIYKFDNAAVTLPSSKAGEAAVVYQMHDPTCVVLQQGMAIRVGAPVDIPGPKSGAGGVVTDRIIQENSPELTPASAQFVYSATWGYTTLLVVNSIAVGDYRDTETGISFGIPVSPITQNPASVTVTVPTYTMTPT